MDTITLRKKETLKRTKRLSLLIITIMSFYSQEQTENIPIEISYIKK